MSLPRPLIAVLVVAAWAQSAAGQDSSLDRYVQMGLESNRELARERTTVRQAEARWSESRAARLPTVQLEARYSAAEGGRTFDVPVGDLLNPVYATLNDLTGTRQFPTLGNQTFPLLREREQDTRVRVTQVVWNPAVGADARSKGFEVQAARAGTEAARRALVRDIRTAYYDYANATRAEEIFGAALDLVTENERSSTAMWQTSLVTRDVVHRARVERLEVEGRLARAATDRQLAASYFNYLLGRDLDASIDLDQADLELPGTGRLGELRRMVALPADEEWTDELADRAVDRRSELEQLDHAVAAAGEGVRAAQGSLRPSVALALDAGIQGRDYGFGEEHRYALASVVMSWNVTNGGADRARIRRASLERERLESEREDAAARIRLELESAVRNAWVALKNLSTTEERVTAAEDAFRLVRRRRDEGLATPLEFLDARASLTRAQLSRSVSETEVLIRLAELDFATGGAVDVPNGEPYAGSREES